MQVMSCFQKTQTYIIKSNAKWASIKQVDATVCDAELKISGISSRTADGFLNGREQRQATAASSSNLIQFKKLSLKRLIDEFKWGLRDCLL